MRKLIIIFLFISSVLQAQTHHVATDGTGDFTSIAQVNAHAFSPGDSILFARGDTFTVTSTTYLNPAYSGTSGHPIVFGAYGTGPDPVITSFTTVTGWTDEGSGIYSKVVNHTDYNTWNSIYKTFALTIDDTMTCMGRYPETGWMVYNSAGYPTENSITDNDLPDSPSFVGGEAIIRKYTSGWTLDRNVITAQASGKLTYTTGSSYTYNAPLAGYGYFLQDSKEILDHYGYFGAWYYNTATSTLYMYFGAEDPNDHVIKMSTTNFAAYIDTKSFWTFDNITIEGFNNFGIATVGSDHLIVQNCTIKNIGMIGIYSTPYGTTTGFTINNNLIEHCGTGINLQGYGSSIIITNNTISNIGLLIDNVGCEKNQEVSEFGDGIVDIHDGTVFQYNVLTNIGHSGIAHKMGDNPTIQYNKIDGFGMTRYDAGGIYIWDSDANNTDGLIDHNIVINSVQANNGFGSNTELYVWGIYLDNGDQYKEVTYNTSSNCHTGGMLVLNSGRYSTINNNTFYNNGEYQLGFEHAWGYGQDITNIATTYNKFIARDSTELAFRYWDDDGHFTTSSNVFNYNYYARPVDDDYTIDTYDSPTTTNYTLSTWKTFSSQDASSNKSLGGTFANTDSLQLIYNDTTVNMTYSLSNVLKDIAGTSYSGSIYLAPYTSLVLLGKGTVTEGFPEDPGEVGFPTVETGTATYTAITANVSYEITSDGGGTLTNRGVCWSTSANPTTSDKKTIYTASIGSFTDVLRGLRGGTTYHVRAYTTNESGTAYGADYSFTTPVSSQGKTSGKIGLTNGKIGILK